MVTGVGCLQNPIRNFAEEISETNISGIAQNTTNSLLMIGGTNIVNRFALRNIILIIDNLKRGKI